MENTDEYDLLMKAIAHMETFDGINSITLKRFATEIEKFQGPELYLQTVRFWISRFDEQFLSTLRVRLDEFAPRRTPMFKRPFYMIIMSKKSFLEITELRDKLFQEYENYEGEISPDQEACLTFLSDFIRSYNYSKVVTKEELITEVKRLQKLVNAARQKRNSMDEVFEFGLQLAKDIMRGRGPDRNSDFSM